MKKCKRVLALILAVMLCCSTSIQVLAEDAVTGDYPAVSDQSQNGQEEGTTGNEENVPVADEQNPETNETPDADVNSGTGETPEVTGNPQENVNSEDNAVPESGEAATEKEAGQVQAVIDYAYVASSQVAINGEQNVVISLMDKNLDIASAVLEFQKEDGQSLETGMVQAVSGAILFKPVTDGLGVYTAKKLTYTAGDTVYTVDLVAEGVEASYEVKEQVDEENETGESADSEPALEDENDMQIAVADDAGNVTTVNSIEEGIEIVKEQNASETLNEKLESQPAEANPMQAYYRTARSGSNEVVIVLDPGHDATHAGAGNTTTGIREEVYTLSIAQACKEELQKYQGVKVYMTRNSAACPYPGTTSQNCNYNRVQYAKSVGADIYVSFHLNSGVSTAKGAEVYISNYSKYKEDSKEIANAILAELAALGLPSRGWKIDADDHDHGKYDDGNWQDDLSVIKNSVLNGFPGILIEHGFIGNTSDAAIIKNKYKEIGKADAKALAEKLGLGTSSVKINGITGGTLNDKGQTTLTANVTSSDKNLKYQFQYYYNGGWYDVAGVTTKNAVTWAPPAAGNYVVNLYVWDSNGKQYSYNCAVEAKANTNTVKIPKITGFTSGKKAPQLLGTTISLTGKVDNKESGSSYEYLAYDGKNWSMISSSKTLGTVNWKPTAVKSYLLCFQVIRSNGQVLQEFMPYEITEPSVKINGITVGSMNSKGEIPLSANVTSSDPGLKYKFMAYDLKYWHDISGVTTSKSTVWKPSGEGTFLLYLEVTGSSGKVTTYSAGYVVNLPAKITGFSADRAYPQNAGTTITLKGSVQAPNTAGFTYEYLAYDGHAWSMISSSKTLGSAKWTPKDGGDYLLCFQVVKSTGAVIQQFIGYNIKGAQVNIKGINVGSLNSQSKIPLSVNIDTNQSGLKYKFMAYDLKYWYNISESTTSKSAVWAPPKEGVYLLYVEVTTPGGKVYTYAQGHEVKMPVKITGFSADRAYPQNAGTTITLKGSVSALSSAGLTYEYLSYQNGYWKMISSSKTLGPVKWTPQDGGDYLLCFQVIKSNGQVLQQFMSYNIKGSYVTIKGIDVGKMDANGNISLKANVDTNAGGLKYQFKYYDLKSWYNITGVSTSNKATWSPKKEGVYLLYVEVTTNAGRQYTYAAGTEVKDSIKITGFKTNYSTPQKVNTPIQLTGTVSASLKDNMTYEYLAYINGYWSLISSSKKAGSATWTPTKDGDYLLCFQVINNAGRTVQQFMSYSITPYYNIMGTTTTSAKQMAAFFMANNSSYDKYTKVSGYNGVLAKGGAKTITEFCQIYIEEAKAEGVKAEVAFTQAMLETGFLKFGGDVKPDQYNFAGLGATGGGVAGNSFKDVRTGIRAQIQHLKCYASTEGLKNACVDPRWSNSLRGKAPYVEWLSIPNNPYGTGWAADAKYAEKIVSYITSLHMHTL